MTYLYALADGLDAVSDLAGVASEPLERVTIEAFVIVFGNLSALPALDRDVLLAQDQVVRQLHARAEALLPMRFGTAVASDADLSHAIRAQAPALRDALARVRGMEQMTVRVLESATAAEGDAPDAAGVTEAIRAPQTGTEYLRRRAAGHVPQKLHPLVERLEGLPRGTRIEAGARPGVLATLYHLIERGHSDAYRGAVDAARDQLAELSLRVSGPSPCYAFAPDYRL